MIKQFAVLVGFILFSSSHAFAEKIIFASPDDLPPKVYREGGELKGIYLDVIREICKRIHAEPEFVTYPWARAVEMARAGKIDAIFPPFKTEERKNFLYFPSEPMSFTRNMVFALKKTHRVVKSLRDLKGLAVGISNQYSYGTEFDAYKKNLTLDLSIDEEMLVQKLGHSSGVKRIDVAIASEESFKFLSNRLGFARDFESVYMLSESPSYVAFAKAKGESAKVLAEKFSKALRLLKKEGFVRKITDKYMTMKLAKGIH